MTTSTREVEIGKGIDRRRWRSAVARPGSAVFVRLEASFGPPPRCVAMAVAWCERRRWLVVGERRNRQLLRAQREKGRDGGVSYLDVIVFTFLLTN